MNERVHYNLNTIFLFGYVYSLRHHEHICLHGYLYICTCESQCRRKEIVLIQTTLKKSFKYLVKDFCTNRDASQVFKCIFKVAIHISSMSEL